MNKFTTSVHTHVLSCFDAQIEADKLCDKIIELGGKGIVVTDHGVLSSIESYRRVFETRGLKFIPGVELYVEGYLGKRYHLVLIAKNDNGYKGICKIVTESNKNLVNDYPIIKKEDIARIMKEYKGDVFALSACMQGVICSIFLLNGVVEKKIEVLRKKQEKHYSPESEEIKASAYALNGCKVSLDEAIAERDELKADSEQKFAKREKAIEKLKKEGVDVTDKEEELNKDKARQKEAQEKLPEAKKAVALARKSYSNAQSVYKEILASVEKYKEYENQILEFKKELKSDDELYEMAICEAKEYMDIFGKNRFLIELQYHGIPEEEICFTKALKLAKELNIKTIASNDVHMLTNSDDDIVRRALLKSLRFSQEYIELTDAEKELYLKDNYEMLDSLCKIIPKEDAISAINNIDVLFDSCNVEFKTDKHYPKYSKTGDADKLLDEAVKEGIKNLFPNGLSKEYKERLNYELGIIKSMGYSDYHLIVKDFLEYGRLLGYIPKEELDNAPLDIDKLKSLIKEKGYNNPGFTIGPGRGSAAGSLVCYLLGITALDPIKYGLLFERFLNPERISMPDIDSDIAYTIRPKVIEYVKHKYGEMAVCGILTMNALAPKGAIETASTFYGLKTYGKSLTTVRSELSKEIPSEIGTSFSTKVDPSSGQISDNDNAITLYDYLTQKHKDNKDKTEVLKWAKIMEGAFTEYGTHAAGICISDNNDVSEYIPLKFNTNLNMFTTQCNMVELEENGLLKFDFLGLKTLDIITDTVRAIEKRTGEIINPLTISTEDEAVYDSIIKKGLTNAVFQFESSGMKQMLKRFKPETFEDLIILVSMFRPGPLQYLDSVIDVKNGKKEISYLCDELKPILSKTYGAIVYQEQVMEICQKLAGFTLGHADQVRRFMSKKKADKLAAEKDAFIEGCSKNNISKEVAETLFTQMMDFASYAFNKSHAAVYAYIAYITAYLKLYYPAEFYASALNWVDKKKYARIISEARTLNVEVLPPCINTSQEEFSVCDSKSILFGLSNIMGVKSCAKEIINERNAHGMYANIKDFFARVKVSSLVMEHLIFTGTLDVFCENRTSVFEFYNNTKAIISSLRDNDVIKKCINLVLPHVETLAPEKLIEMQKEAGLKVCITENTTVSKLENKLNTVNKNISNLTDELNAIRLSSQSEDKITRIEEEKKYLGIYVSMHPMDLYPSNEKMGIGLIEDVYEETEAIYGIITNVKEIQTKNGSLMAVITVEDKTDSIEVVCFPKPYSQYKDMINIGSAYVIYGTVDIDDYKSSEEETVYNVILNAMESVIINKPAIMVPVSSYATFHIDFLDIFKEDYESPNGYPLLIYDKSLGEIREMPFTVSEDVKSIKDAVEISL